MPKNNEIRYKGPKRFIEYKEAHGRIIKYLRFWHSPADAQAVIVQFTDGTQIHIGIEALLRVQAEMGRLEDGDLKVNKTYRTSPRLVANAMAGSSRGVNTAQIHIKPQKLPRRKP